MFEGCLLFFVLLFFPQFDLRCIPALFLVNETYSGAWKEKLSQGVRQGETAAGKLYSL